MPVLNPTRMVNHLVEWIQSYHKTTQVQRAELDLSGGVDSAVMAGLLVLALGRENVTLAHLGIHTNPVQTARAKEIAGAIGCPLAILDVTDEYEALIEKIIDSLTAVCYREDEIRERIAKDPTVLGSIRSTLRAPLGRAYNRLTGGGIRHGTGNECEDRFLRFYQKGGDGEVDTNPLSHLSKTEVYQVALELGRMFGGQNPNAIEAFRSVVRCKPSADLWGTGDQHNDEDEIRNWTGANLTYGRVDPETGKVLSYGTIEMVARFVDACPPPTDIDSVFGDAFFSYVKYFARNWDEKVGLDELVTIARAMSKAEKRTRHKLNPNIPGGPTREEMIRAGVLSNNLKDYGV